MAHKICLIAPEFYHYHTSIVDCLVRKGNKVVFYPELPNGFFYRLVKNLHNGLYKLLLDRYFQRIFDNLERQKIDIFLFIRAEVVPVDFLRCLRGMFSNSHFIMYQWDSCLNNNYERLLPYFDSVSTFDPLDAENFSIEYRPLFYIGNNNVSASGVRDIDFFFVGSMNAQRIYQFRKFKKALPANASINVYISLYVTVPSFIKYLMKTFDFQALKEVSFRKVSVDKLNLMMSKSKNVIDYSSASQTGISVRSFEALANGARLITNNSTILEVFPELSSAVVVVDPINFKYQRCFSEILDTSLVHDQVKGFEIHSWLDKVLTK